MQNIDFSQIRNHDGSQSKGFEELVCQLARLSKPENAKEFIRKDGVGGDAGVECYWKLQDGSEHAWQAKYFLKPLGSSQWSQISRSVKSALSKHPDLTKYYICLPKDRNDSRRSSTQGRQITSELDKWNQHVEKWKAIAATKSMQVEFEYWGEHEILLMLQKDTSDFAGIAKYWFGPPIPYPTDILPHRYFPKELVDEKIKDEINTLRKSRYFPGFDRVNFSLILARKLVEGELAGGTATVRCRALAWCVRILSIEDRDKAEEYLKFARELGTCEEIDIANAFIFSQKGDKNAALSALTPIDSPMSRSAAFMIVVHHNGPQGAVDWLKTTGINATALDSDGKRLLLGCQLELADWEAAQECLGLLTDDDLRDTPALHHLKAITHLLRAVPKEHRSGVLQQPPFEAADLRLRSNSVALEALRVAHSSFINASKVACQLSCPIAEKISDEYALWLELRDSDKYEEGRERLKSKLNDPKTALHLVHLGFQFKIKLDKAVIEQEIEQQKALNGEMTYDTAKARLAMVFRQQSPEEAANYIVRYYDELVSHINKKSLLFLQIDLFSQAGQLEKVKECRDILLQEGLPEIEESRLRIITSEAEGKIDPVESLKEQFKKTDSLNDLVNLVHRLKERDDWNGLCEYGIILFERTEDLRDAEDLALALYNSEKNEQIVEFLKSNKELLIQSKNLPMLYCWSLYQEGEFLEARSELAKLNGDWDDEKYRTLQIYLAISLGDWNSLHEFVAKEYQEKDKRNARELIRTAQLALQLKSPYAKELIRAAANKGNDNAGVLGAAHFLATRAGWEDDPEVSEWIPKAVALSGDDGPIWKMTLKDFLDQVPEWNRQASEIWEQLGRGEIPMFLAAEGTNKSLNDLMLFPAFANLSERDTRRRVTIPAYSGRREPLPLDTDRQIGMDATTLLTLSFLNLLDKAFDAFATVHIPHSTLGWLFDEKQRVAFHQPSRIEDARQIRDFLATGALEKLSPTTVPDSDLSALVGDDLALLIAEAEKASVDNGTQRIVVRPSPVYRSNSLMEKEADLTAHATVLSSCQSIVDKLRQKGQITSAEEKKARAYLQLQEKRWTDQPEIADGAILYLDDLAIAYFQYLGILEKLQAAGFKAFVSPSKVSEINQLISYERISDKAEEAIEHIRSAVNLRIKSGKIKVGRQITIDQPAERSLSGQPTFGVFSLGKGCDAIISDDRFLNQHSSIKNNDVSMPVFSTLDLIDTLTSTNSLTAEERLESRTQLRQAGYIFVPVSEDELAHHLDACTIKDGKVDETAKLKAIRENILHVRMGNWLQLPEEAHWLVELQRTFVQVLKDQWKAGADFSIAQARSDWIRAQIDIRGWAHSYGTEGGANIVKIGRSAHIMALLIPPVEEPQQIKDEYWNWVENRILAPIKEQYPDLYLELVEWHRRWIAETADMDLIEGRGNDE